jgi:hypothetical protein
LAGPDDRRPERRASTRLAVQHQYPSTDASLGEIDKSHMPPCYEVRHGGTPIPEPGLLGGDV